MSDKGCDDLRRKTLPRWQFRQSDGQWHRGPMGVMSWIGDVQGAPFSAEEYARRVAPEGTVPIRIVRKKRPDYISKGIIRSQGFVDHHTPRWETKDGWKAFCERYDGHRVIIRYSVVR